MLGYLFIMAGSPVSWVSQHQKTVATLIMNIEYVTGIEVAKEAVWLWGFINDLHIPRVYIEKIPLYINNNSTLKLMQNPENHSRSKHIDVKHYFIHKKVEEGVVDTQYVDTKDNLADILTKLLPQDTHQGLMECLNMGLGRAMMADDGNTLGSFCDLLSKYCYEDSSGTPDLPLKSVLVRDPTEDHACY